MGLVIVSGGSLKGLWCLGELLCHGGSMKGLWCHGGNEGVMVSWG